MNKEDFIKTLTGAAKLYGKELDTETIMMWLSFFKNDTTEEFKNAISHHIKTSSKFPTIADIKKLIASKKTSDIPKAEDEWNRVIDLVHKYGSYAISKALSEMSDYTRYIVSHIGYIRICNANSDEQIWNKKAFIEEYNDLKDKNIEMLQLENTNYVQKLIEIEVIK